VSFAAITLCVASQRSVLKISIHFFMDSVLKLFDTPPYHSHNLNSIHMMLLRPLLGLFVWSYVQHHKRNVENVKRRMIS